MKNLFVPYEIALLAKEKEFDEPCLSSYNTKKQLTIASTFGLKNSDLIDDFLKYGYEVTAPLYQQIIDWFLTRGISIEINTTLDSLIAGKPKFHYGASKFKGKRDYMSSSEFDNRYECMNKAIEEAFKLI